MSELVKINEFDLFNFAFFKDMLTEEKSTFIKKNIDKFEQISFYIKQKNSMNDSLTRTTKEKIAARIPAYKI